MLRRWCTVGDAQEVMHRRWCTTGDAPQGMDCRGWTAGDASQGCSWQFWQILIILSIFGNFDIFGKLYIFDEIDNFWQIWQFFASLTISGNFDDLNHSERFLIFFWHLIKKKKLTVVFWNFWIISACFHNLDNLFNFDNV